MTPQHPPDAKQQINELGITNESVAETLECLPQITRRIAQQVLTWRRQFPLNDLDTIKNLLHIAKRQRRRNQSHYLLIEPILILVDWPKGIWMHKFSLRITIIQSIQTLGSMWRNKR